MGFHKQLFFWTTLALLIFALVGGVSGYYGHRTPQSVMSTIRASKTLRCGYWMAEPFIKRDPNSGKISGLAVEYLEQAAKRHGLLITWEREVGLDQIVPSLNYGQIDAFCLPCTPTPDWEKQLDFAGRFAQIPSYIYVGSGSPITEADLTNARFATIDGYAQAQLTSEKFPKAKIVSLPNSASLADLFNQVQFNKADAVVSDDLSASNYMRNNPHALRRLETPPLQTNATFFPIKKGEKDLAIFFETMTDPNQPENKTAIQTLEKKYGLSPNSLIWF